MRGEAWGSKEMLCAMCTLISGAASKAIRKRARAAAYAPDKGCCPVTSSGAISDVIKCNQRRHQGAARCDQADDLSEGLESARSTARSPEGIETRLHAVCHYGSCDACDGPGVELRGRPRVGLGVALSLVCGPWTPTRGKPERRRGPPFSGRNPSEGRNPSPYRAVSSCPLSGAARRLGPVAGVRGAGARIARCYRFVFCLLLRFSGNGVYICGHCSPQSLHGMVVRLDQTGLCGPPPRPCRAPTAALHRPPLARAQRSLG